MVELKDNKESVESVIETEANNGLLLKVTMIIHNGKKDNYVMSDMFTDGQLAAVHVKRVLKKYADRFISTRCRKHIPNELLMKRASSMTLDELVEIHEILSDYSHNYVEFFVEKVRVNHIYRADDIDIESRRFKGVLV